MRFSKNLILACAISMASLLACNSTESADAKADDPAFASVRVDSAFFGTWTGSVSVPSNGQLQPVEFTLSSTSAVGRNFSAGCNADLTPLKAEKSKAYYRVKLKSGTCIQDALMEFISRSPDALGIRMHYPTEPENANDLTLMASGVLSRK